MIREHVLLICRAIFHAAYFKFDTRDSTSHCGSCGARYLAHYARCPVCYTANPTQSGAQ